MCDCDSDSDCNQICWYEVYIYGSFTKCPSLSSMMLRSTVCYGFAIYSSVQKSI